MIDKQQNDGGCCAPQQSGQLSVDEGRQRILELVAPVSGFERIALRSALGRVLYEPVRSPIDVPAHNNSAMDGYALRHADLATAQGAGLKLVGTSLAGHPFAGEVNTGECVRIMTGAVMPSGADTVVMQEVVSANGEQITIQGNLRAGENVRYAGEDIQCDAIARESGVLVEPSDLGLLASLGVAEVMVRRRPRVAFFSTGDELRSVGQVPEPGTIYDSNRYTLYGMLTRLGVDLLDMGVIDGVFPLEELMPKCLEMAAFLATKNPAAYAEIKRRMKIDMIKIMDEEDPPYFMG